MNLFNDYLDIRRENTILLSPASDTWWDVTNVGAQWVMLSYIEKTSMAFNYVNLIEYILADKRLDHILKDDSEFSVQTFKSFTNIANRPSLCYYKTVKGEHSSI